MSETNNSSQDQEETLTQQNLLNQLHFQKVPMRNQTPVPMEVDKAVYQEATPPSKEWKKQSPEQVAQLQSKIQAMVKNQVKIYQQVSTSLENNQLEGLKKQLHLAMESQKALQKLISQKEVESYVKGWNPWTQMKISFPKKKENKKRQKSSIHTKYNNPKRWAQVEEMVQTLKAADQGGHSK